MDDLSYSRGWLRAFFDGEGCVSAKNKTITLTNTEQSVIEDALRHLALFGITPRRYDVPRGDGRKPITRLVIGRGALTKVFIDEIGSSISYKRAAMDAILVKIATPRCRRTKWGGPPIPSAEELLYLRDTEKLTRPQIAERLGISRNMVTPYLRHHGIARHRRNESLPDPEEVRRAYWDEGLSLKELGYRFGYGGTSIRGFMAREGIAIKKLGWQNSTEHRERVKKRRDVHHERTT